MRNLIERYLETMDDETETEESGTERDVSGAILEKFLKWYAAQRNVQSDLEVRCAKCGGTIGATVDYKLV